MPRDAARDWRAKLPLSLFLCLICLPQSNDDDDDVMAMAMEEEGALRLPANKGSGCRDT